MSEQSRSLLCSIGIHLTVCVLAFGIIRGTTPERKTLIIDFSLVDQPKTAWSSQPLYRTEAPIPVKVPQNPVAAEKKIVREPTPQVQRVAATEAQVAVKAPEPKIASVPDTGREVPTSSVNPGTEPASGRGKGPAGLQSPSGAEVRPEVRYVKEHFAVSRNAIVSRLSYPRHARKMGAGGTVKVSFVVNEDGSVKSVKVLATSGFDALDSNAVETIRRCSPYPKPPCAAEMVMPITYNLD